ncbi:phosphatase PAP2 family protein [Propioniciclava sp.]|uniref:phosphatase PAP2 family protein n=1 Tax=Propioniciclava sp. TaxID=2038686 RepID=UPI00261C6BA9|nr:phosphatase PAP2 family protein [Propioniciclava sp.]
MTLGKRLLPLAYLPVFLAWYFALEGRDTASMIVVESPLDALVPFDATWIVGYLAWFPFLLGGIAWLYAVDLRAFREIPRFAWLLIVGMTACLIGYTLWPTTVTLRPEVYPDQGWATAVVAGLQGFDDPANVFPSLHVYTSIVVAHCIAASRYVRRAWVRVAAWVACVLIAASTCFLKQHSVLDAAGAAALFAIVLGAWHVLPRTVRPPRPDAVAD